MAAANGPASPDGGRRTTAACAHETRTAAPASTEAGGDASTATVAGETHAPHQNRSATGARFLGNKRSVVQAMIAAEVLGKPRAFNDEYLPH